MVQFISDNNVECPIQWGDRVDHRQHGFGTVNGNPTPYYGGSYEGGVAWTGVSGWHVPVSWDDPDVAVSEADFHRFGKSANNLVLIDRPDAKGVRYWEAKWAELIKSVQSARQATDRQIDRSFRSGTAQSHAELAQLLEQEVEAIKALQDFTNRDNAGEHQ